MTQEAEVQVAELKMLGFVLGANKLDGISTEYIRGTSSGLTRLETRPGR